MDSLLEAVETALRAYNAHYEVEDFKDITTDGDNSKIYATIDGTPVVITIKEL